MKNTIIILAIPLTLATTVLTGCISVHKVHIKDAPHRKVEFESADAMRTFYEALLAKHFPTGGKPNRIRVGETLYTSETRPSASVVFNEGVALADSNSDGLVSIGEAKAFAANSSQQASP